MRWGDTTLPQTENSLLYKPENQNTNPQRPQKREEGVMPPYPPTLALWELETQALQSQLTRILYI